MLEGSVHQAVASLHPAPLCTAHAQFYSPRGAGSETNEHIPIYQCSIIKIMLTPNTAEVYSLLGTYI